MTMGIAEHLLLQDLKRRVEALEAALSAARKPLRERDARPKAEGVRLRDTIREIRSSYDGHLSAQRVRQALASAGI